MHKIIAAVLALSSGCATTTLGLDREIAPAPSVRVQLPPMSASVLVGGEFPDIVDPSLPAANRLERQIRDQLGDRAVATVALCVRPSGKVASVDLVHGSTMAAFDAAVLHDTRAWEAAKMPGPDTVQVCQHVTIDYRLHR